MRDAGLMAVTAQPAGQFFGQCDRSVLTSGAPDRNREVTLALARVRRDEHLEQMFVTLQELGGRWLIEHVATDGFVELPAEQTDFPAGTLAPFWPW